MKNLHVLPTDHPSRLRYNIKTRIWELNEFHKYHTDIKSTHNIYITSDEEIKMQDWCITAKGNLLQMIEGDTALGFALLGCKKIILTTDQDLINDGIEQISEDTLLKIVEHINSGKNNETQMDYENCTKELALFHIQQMYRFGDSLKLREPLMYFNAVEKEIKKYEL